MRKNFRELSLFVLLACTAQPGGAFVFQQDDWSGGAAVSTTSALSGWSSYELQNGFTETLSSGVQNVSYSTHWYQTDGSLTQDGFLYPGSLFSSTTLSGSGLDAFVHIATYEAVNVLSPVLPVGRGDMAVAALPGTEYAYLFGGNGADGYASSATMRWDGRAGILETSGFSDLIWPVAEAGVAFDSSTQNRYYFFGGSSGTVLDDRILYAEMPPFGNISLPTGKTLSGGARRGAAAAYHPYTSEVYVFGGMDGTPSYFDQISRYRPFFNDVLSVSTAMPSGRAFSSAVYYPPTDEFIVFGGTSAAGAVDEIFKFDPATGSSVTAQATLPTGRWKMCAAYYPDIDKILLFGGTSSVIHDEVLQYDVLNDSLTVRPVTLPSPRAGLGCAYNDYAHRIFLFGGSSGTASDFDQILEYTAFSSGSYTSAVFDSGNLSSLDTLDYEPAAQSTDVVQMALEVRAGNTPVPDVSWSNSGVFVQVANGGSLAPFSPGGARYVQYRATFTTTDVSTSAVLHRVDISYLHTAATATLRSNPIDTGHLTNVLQNIQWGGDFPADTTAQFQIRTTTDDGSGFPDSGQWSEWLGPSGSDDWYTNPGGSDTIHPAHRDGRADQWFQYRVLMGSTDTFSRPIVSTVTVQFNYNPLGPVMTSLTADSTRQITAAWTDASDNEDEFILSTGTFADPDGADYILPTADQAGTGGVYNQAVTGLSPNVPYYAQVRAHILPPDDLTSSTSPASELTVFTLANPPNALAVPSVHVTSITVSWGANGNSGITRYEVSTSTDDFTLAFSTPVLFTENLTATTTDIADLAAGTTLYIRVRAQNGNGVDSGFSGVVSTTTPPSPLSGLAVDELYVSSIVWRWDTSGPAARYRVYQSTSMDFLADIGTTYYTQTGLSTNTLNGVRVQPYTSSADGLVSAGVSTYTLAAVPESLRADFVSTDTVALSWDDAGNSAGTEYELSFSTDGFALHHSTPMAFSDGLVTPATTLFGLDAGTTYSFRLRAGNDALVPTDFSVVLTTPTHPGTLGAPAGGPLGVSSMTWSWANTAGPAVVGYEVFRASDGVLIATTSAASLVETGLSTNTEYGVQVRAVDLSGKGGLSPPTTYFTLAAKPSGTAITEVFVSSLTFAWDARGNTSTTTYEVDSATDGAVFTLLTSVTTDFLSPQGLMGSTTYYFRVRAFNGDGVYTEYDVTVTTYVVGAPPLPASALTAVPVGGARILLDWDISPTSTVVQYSLYMGSGSLPIDYGVLFASTTGGTTYYLTPALTAGTSYHFGLRAKDESGAEEANSHVTATAVALAGAPALSARIRSPPSGRTVSGDRVTLSAELFAGAETDADEILFQYKPDFSSTWLDVTAADARHPNPARAPPFAVHWDSLALPDGDYDVRAVAKNGSGTDDPYPPAGTVRLAAGSPDIDERSLGGGSCRKRVRVYKDGGAEIVLLDVQSSVELTLVLSSGSVSADETMLRVESRPGSVPGMPASLADPGIVYDISLESGQSLLAGGRTARLSLSHLDQDGDSRVDGTEVRADNLEVYYYDAAQGRWRPVGSGSVSPDDETTLAADTPHFTLFAAVSPASTDLSAVRVYPVPYKPNGENPDEGKPWTAGDPTSGLVFDNLTVDSRVKLYTVTGSLVWESEPSPVGGLIRWDARNGDGTEVSSGVYYAVISSPGGRPVVRKVVVIR